jgi:adenosylcobalamin-dependent ribonucleoside-triphosphate reductase
MTSPSFRAQLITRRTYNRPLDEAGTVFETWEQTVDRVIGHQQWLWERAKGSWLSNSESAELGELRQLMLDRKITTSGRTLWLGGSEVAKTREASQFNCSFQNIEDVYDVVDAFWLLLQGCGVGFAPTVGTLSGFTQPVEIEVRRSKNLLTKGVEQNHGQILTVDGKRVYELFVGDSAEAWAKSIGKIMAMKDRVDKIVLDFTSIRAAGIRLKGYGWISSGDQTISKAFVKICEILNRRAGQLLTKIDILDVLNWMGTTLSSRRSAEIAVMDAHDSEAEAFMLAKKDSWATGNEQRGQSNNSIVFWHKPTKLEMKGVFQMMMDAGGSEPGFLNGVEAKRRGPWFKGVNPCAEILLGNKSFCNLVEVDWGKFATKEHAHYDHADLRNAIYLAARANYRQTCVNLKDGILSETWHELNEFLRLCGVGATGIVKWLDVMTGLYQPGYVGQKLEALRVAAHSGANRMADTLGLPRPKAITTIKPSGTLSKIMDTTEGVHKPLGKYVFNNVRFSKHDPLVQLLRDANFYVFDDPYADDGVLARLPVAYEDVEFDVVDGLEVNVESAIKQLERYKLMMDHYVDHNCSITVSYDPSEVPEIVEWLDKNWDCFVGVSWLYRNDPTKTAEDLGFPYLPQQVVTKEVYDEYVSTLLPVDIDAGNSLEELTDADCATGACPIR